VAARRYSTGISGYERFGDKTLNSGDVVGTYSVGKEANCASICSNSVACTNPGCYSADACTFFTYDYEKTSSNCVLYRGVANRPGSMVAQPYSAVYGKTNAIANYLTQFGDPNLNKEVVAQYGSEGRYLVCCTTSGGVPSNRDYERANCGIGFNWGDANNRCASYGLRLCSSAEVNGGLARNYGTCSMNNNNWIWVNNVVRVPPGEAASSPFIAYTYEEGIFGMDGFSKTPAATANKVAVRAIAAIPVAASLFNDVTGKTCVRPVAAAFAHADAFASLVQREALARDRDAESDTLIEPIIVTEEPDEDLSLLEVSHRDPALPLGLTGVAGVIDASLRRRHVPLGASESDFSNILQPRVIESEEDPVAIPSKMRNEEMPLKPAEEAAPSLRGTVMASQRIAAPESRHDVIHQQEELMNALAVSIAEHSHVPAVHARPAHDTAHHITEMLLAELSQSATNGSSTVKPAVWNVSCPDDCDPSACTVAQSSCAPVLECRSSCIFAICTGEAASSAASNAQLCDQRTRAANDMAKARQAALEDEAAGFSASSPGARLSLCPAFVSGSEPWNVPPYDKSIPAWTAELLPQIQRAIDLGSSPLVARNSTAAPSNSTMVPRSLSVAM